MHGEGIRMCIIYICVCMTVYVLLGMCVCEYRYTYNLLCVMVHICKSACVYCINMLEQKSKASRYYAETPPNGYHPPMKPYHTLRLETHTKRKFFVEKLGHIYKTYTYIHHITHAQSHILKHTHIHNHTRSYTNCKYHSLRMPC